MESTVSVRFIPGASTNGIAHQVKGCLWDISPDTIILHHETNNMKIGNTAEKIANNISNLAVTIRSEKTKALISRLKSLNNFWKKKYFVENLSFIDNQKIKKMLNQSGLHLNEYGTRRLVKKFYYNLINWWDTICLDRNTNEKSVKTKKVNGNLNFNVSTANTNSTIISCPETQNRLRGNKGTSRNKIKAAVHIHKFKNIGDKTQKMLY